MLQLHQQQQQQLLLPQLNLSKIQPLMAVNLARLVQESAVNNDNIEDTKIATITRKKTRKKKA